MTDAWHRSDCRLRISATCGVAVECPHGFDVCPQCDPCHCTDTRQGQRRNSSLMDQRGHMRLHGIAKDRRNCTDRRKS